jgi:3-oxoacyl-[acyl-carrier protein] reductase
MVDIDRVARRLEDQVVIVTGGTGLLGRAFVSTLLREGARVAFAYNRSVDQAAAMASALNANGNLRSYQVDVRNAASVCGMIDDVLNVWGRIDGLINNAAVVRDRLLLSLDETAWRDVIDTNLSGTYTVSRPVISHMVRAHQGVILNIGSVSGLRGVRGQTNYCAAKAGLIGFTRALAAEVAPHGVRVNVLVPGAIEGGMTEGLSPRRLEEIKASIPCRRFGRPEEIVNVAMFLLSSAASYLTGQVVCVDGGLSSV